MRVAVLGATGFVGSGVVAQLKLSGIAPIAVKAPRIDTDQTHYRPQSPSQKLGDEILHQLAQCDVIVNCAGDPDASSSSLLHLQQANAFMPAMVAAAAAELDMKFIHVSSAAVQGSLTLDSQLKYDARTPYSKSKQLGEELVLRSAPNHAVIYRPPSVHAPTRRISRAVARLAASPISVVATPRDSPTPQAHHFNVSTAIAFVATNADIAPSVVHHPWEGLTTSSYLQAMGGRRPVSIPRTATSRALRALSGFAPLIKQQANVRRAELLLLGQLQAQSWLTSAGWTTSTTLADWEELGRECRREILSCQWPSGR